MPARLVLVAIVILATLFFLARPNPVSRYDRCGAYSPATSRCPESLGLRPESVKRQHARGTLRAAGEGRFYIDRRALRRDQRNDMMVLVIAMIVASMILIT